MQLFIIIFLQLLIKLNEAKRHAHHPAYSPQEKRPRSTKQQNMPATFNFEQVPAPHTPPTLFAEATIFNTRQKWEKTHTHPYSTFFIFGRIWWPAKLLQILKAKKIETLLYTLTP